MKPLLLAISILSASTLHAQITYNTSASAANHSVSSITFSLTVGAGSNRVAICSGVGIDTGAMDAGTLTSIVFNGSETAASIGSVELGGTDMRLYLTKIVAPTVTTANVVLTWSASKNGMAAGCVVANGVDQTTVNRTMASDHDDATPDLTVTSMTNDLIVDAISGWCNEVSGPGSGQTSHTAADDGSCGAGGVYGIHMSSKSATGTSTTTSWVLAAGNAAVYAGLALIPATTPPDPGPGFPLKDIFTPIVIQ